MTKRYFTSSNWANFWSDSAYFLSGFAAGANFYRIYRSHRFHTRALPNNDSVSDEKIDHLIKRNDELSTITEELLSNSTAQKK